MAANPGGKRALVAPGREAFERPNGEGAARSLAHSHAVISRKCHAKCVALPIAREMLDILYRLELDASVLILLPRRNETIEKSAKNIPDVKTVRASYLNVRDLLNYDYLLMPLGSLEVIEGILG